MESDVLAEMIAVIDLIGVFANALLGGAVARAHRLDPVGFVVLAILSALGGGMLRDVLLQAGPPAALVNDWYLPTALAGAAIAFLIKFEGRLWDAVFPWIDALALGCWAAVGTQKALDFGLGPMPAALLGVITAVGGGAVRDIALGKVPAVLGRNALVATPALLTAIVVVVVNALDYRTFAAPVATFIGAGLSLIAWRKGWLLPEAVSWETKRVRRIVARARRSRRRPAESPAERPNEPGSEAKT